MNRNLTHAFSAGYEDPKWKKKRLEIIKQSGEKCQRCKRSDKQLHVHHLSYKTDRSPWEYPDSNLVCLCEDCHAELHYLNDEIKRLNRFFSEAWCMSIFDEKYDVSHLVRFMTMILCMKDESAIQASNMFADLAGILEREAGDE